MSVSIPFPCVLATGNADKVREILELFTDATAAMLAAAPLVFESQTCGYVVAPGDTIASALLDVARLTERPQIEETGATLEENATIKADGMHAATGMLAIADDTGLEVDALGGAPGVRSARFAGEHATYADNVVALLRALDGVAPESRTAHFTTVVHVAGPHGIATTVRGTVVGTIATTPRGEGTFGYDPVFVPAEGDGRTFAQMSSTEKHALSHRGRAFRALVHEFGLAERDGVSRDTRTKE